MSFPSVFLVFVNRRNACVDHYVRPLFVARSSILRTTTLMYGVKYFIQKPRAVGMAIATVLIVVDGIGRKVAQTLKAHHLGAKFAEGNVRGVGLHGNWACGGGFPWHGRNSSLWWPIIAYSEGADLMLIGQTDSPKKRPKSAVTSRYDCSVRRLDKQKQKADKP
jgi:hypothetical protein